jgi:hypothetical protein
LYSKYSSSEKGHFCASDLQNTSLAGLLYPSASNESPCPSGILKLRIKKEIVTILAFVIAVYLKKRSMNLSFFHTFGLTSFRQKYIYSTQVD